ncbi:hypothetical protein ACQP2F_28410 [Actinoplanes sp. CA-030573]|uniref:hypothetical protein n=1 Tax=Actinoplanes sp. CA-030573 TaxID=3239898 RepID=UPI003D8ADAF4
MTVAELRTMIEGRDVFRAKAVFELAARASGDESAVAALAHVSRIDFVRDDRLFHLVSLAWAAIIGLLAAETPSARRAAYEAFADLSATDQGDLLRYLKADSIESAHPASL